MSNERFLALKLQTGSWWKMRRKTLAKRERNGKPQRTQLPELPSATEVKRLQHAAMVGMRDAVWATHLGYYFLNGKITTAQFAAGKMWDDLATQYKRAIDTPRLPVTANLERSGSSTLDVDSEEGRKRARREAAIAKAYTDARAMLRNANPDILQAVIDVCEQNVLPVGVHGLEKLAIGLQLLAAFWSSGRVKRH